MRAASSGATPGKMLSAPEKPVLRRGAAFKGGTWGSRHPMSFGGASKPVAPPGQILPCTGLCSLVVTMVMSEPRGDKSARR